MSEFCCVDVRDSGRWPSFHRCSRKSLVVREGKPYCRQHDPEKMAKKKAARDAKYEADMLERAYGWHGKKFYQALVEIAESPGAVAKDIARKTLEEFRKEYGK